MAKGHKLTTSRTERYLYSYNHGQGTATMESPELREDEIWSMVNNTPYEDWTPHGRRRVDRHVGGLSLAFENGSGNAISSSSSRIMQQFRGQDLPRGRHVATSAPVNVPDWSKIYRTESVESLHDYDDVDEDEMVPPHEYLAREYRKMAANSVLEGVGRTLKGRDMSRVRDAVWSQTGFDG